MPGGERTAPSPSALPKESFGCVNSLLGAHQQPESLTSPDPRESIIRRLAQLEGGAGLWPQDAALGWSAAPLAWRTGAPALAHARPAASAEPECGPEAGDGKSPVIHARVT